VSYDCFEAVDASNIKNVLFYFVAFRGGFLLIDAFAVAVDDSSEYSGYALKTNDGPVGRHFRFSPVDTAQLVIMTEVPTVKMSEILPLSLHFGSPLTNA
jgi:hypothetical protein